MLAGFVVCPVLTGTLSLLLSWLAGHPPLICALSYILAGACGMLAFLLAAASATAARGS